MITIDEFSQMIADSFFNGSVETAGIVLYVVVMALIFGFTRNIFQTLIIALPVTFLFSPAGLSMLPTDIVLLLTVVLVLGLAMTSKKAVTK